MANMIDVKKAEELIERYSIKLDSETVDLEQLEGRVLAKSIFASRQQPPFNRVAMDGIAINYKYITTEKISLEGIQKSGVSPLTLIDSGAALEVMTGASLPGNTDTVIAYEKVAISESKVSIHKIEDVSRFQNIHSIGSDYNEGDLLLERNLKLNSSAIAIIASQGHTSAEVLKHPSFAIISTGDELIAPGSKCEDWQIWRSNAFALKAELKEFGIPEAKIDLFHLEDEREIVFNKLKKVLTNYDALIISGGVSMGKFDFVQAVMNDLGVKTHFYKVKQRPGKPMFFGSTEEGTAVYALPGNPVSAIFCMRRYVLTALRTSLKQKRESLRVVLKEDISFKREFTLFKAVSLTSDDAGRLIAEPIESNGSGDFSGLAKSAGFIELPAEDSIHLAGKTYRFFPWNGGAL